MHTNDLGPLHDASATGAGALALIHAFWPALLLVVLWTLFWKGLALWHSARRGQSWWFLILLIVNTLGILEMVYLFLILKIRFAELFGKE